jgi:hypothetical protein
MKHEIIKTAKIVILGLIVGVGVNYLFAWTGPCGSGPTACNVAAPLNVGTTVQTKAGDLGVNAFTAALNSSFMGQVGIGTATLNPAIKLEVLTNSLGQGTAIRANSTVRNVSIDLIGTPYSGGDSDAPGGQQVTNLSFRNHSDPRFWSVGFRGISDTYAPNSLLISYFNNKTTTKTPDKWANAITLKPVNSSTGLSTGDLDWVLVGIGKNDPQSKLDVDGNVRGGNFTGTAFTPTSDMRLKTDIKNLSAAEAGKLLTLNGVAFKWKDQTKGNGTNMGFIAQDVEKVYPDTVMTDKQGIKSLNYDSLIAPLVEIVKKQQKEIDVLKVEIEVLKQKTANLTH